MAGTFKFELVSPERILLSGDAEQAVLPGSEGQMTVFAGHAPVVTTLRPGMIEVAIDGGTKKIFVKSGFAEIDHARVTVLAEVAYDASELDAGKLASELAAAEAELASSKDDEALMMAAAAVEQLKALGGKAA